MTKSFDLESLALAASESEWVKSMHEHYESNRFFRPEDLKRVLGDQTKAADMPRDDRDADVRAVYFTQ